jgi:hypothetical protein
VQPDQLGIVLAAARDGFGNITAALLEHQPQAGTLLPAFAMAAAAAADARDAVLDAPSLPAAAPASEPPWPAPPATAGRLADTLADAAGSLGARLRSADAADPRDRACLATAAGHAEAIRGYLMRA